MEQTRPVHERLAELFSSADIEYVTQGIALADVMAGTEADLEQSPWAGKSNKQGFCQGRSQASVARPKPYWWAVSGSKMAPRKFVTQ